MMERFVILVRIRVRLKNEPFYEFMTKQIQQELLILCARLLRQCDKGYSDLPLMGSQPATDIAIEKVSKFAINLIQDE